MTDLMDSDHDRRTESARECVIILTIIALCVFGGWYDLTHRPLPWQKSPAPPNALVDDVAIRDAINRGSMIQVSYDGWVVEVPQ